MEAINRILVTGSNGFIGSHLVKHLSECGIYNVYGTVRILTGNLVSSVKYYESGDIGSCTDWRVPLEGVQVVFHLASCLPDSGDESLYRTVNVDGTLNLAKQAVEAGVRQFIYLSSIKVNGELTASDRPYVENDKPDPQDDYAISKYEAERLLLELSRSTDMDVVIVRPPLVYGPGVKGNFYNFIKVIEKGFPLPVGAASSNRRSLISVGNLVDFLATLVGNKKAAGEIFLVSDGEDTSTVELVRIVATALYKKPRLIYVPRRLMKTLLTAVGKKGIYNRLFGSLHVDITKARDVLGWRPVEDMRKSIHDAVNSLSSTR